MSKLSVLTRARQLAVAAVTALCPTALIAQGLFSPAYTVNSGAVTHYELNQRIRFMEVLGLPGNPEEIAAEELINDRLKQAVLREVGIEPTTEAIEGGMEVFAERANLSRQEFIQALAQEGVEEQTFRDFVKINLGWRDFISGQYLEQARPTPREIDRALGQQGSGGLRVLLSEIIIPITPDNVQAVETEAARLSQIRSFSDFAAEAERFSATDSRFDGGRLDWMPITNLPPALRPIILALAPGEVTSPLSIPNAIALFQLRDLQEVARPAPRYSEIDYAIFYLAGGRSAETLAYASELRATMDRCNDLYGAALGLPEDVLFRDTVAPSQIPGDVALELAKLDDGEVSTALTTQDGRLMFLMLCSRTPETTDEEAREQMALTLTQQRLNAFSESLIAQLRANAFIVRK